jgi:hypothetical protein
MSEDAEVIGHGKTDTRIAMVNAQRRVRSGGEARFQIGDWRLEIGDWRLEIGDWRFEI